MAEVIILFFWEDYATVWKKKKKKDEARTKKLRPLQGGCFPR